MLVIEHLKTRRLASAVEISHALRVTPANIRHHLAVLQEEGVVRVAGERAAGGRGRPILLYSLTEQLQAHNLDMLSHTLLQEFVASLPDEERAVTLERVAKRLAGQVEPPSGSLTQRLNGAIRRLNELHYQARWEARRDAPRLILGHCPYAAILSRHPELCQMDAALLECLLAAPISQTARLATDPRGEVYCSFDVLRSTVRELSEKE